MRIYKVQSRTPNLLENLLNIWEASVRATHLFLSNVEINKIKEYVPKALREVEHLIVATDDESRPLAFMGVAFSRLEMLFVAPEKCGMGIGKNILLYGIENYGIIEVTVNEQNPQAIGFYEHMGFECYKRTDIDENGNPYPLLYMKLTQ